MTPGRRRAFAVVSIVYALGLLPLLGGVATAAVAPEDPASEGRVGVAAPLQETDRSLATTWVVNSTADSGPGTLREAMAGAVGGDTITFNPTIFPPSNPMTVSVTSPLPPVTQGDLTIDASTAGVILDGSTLADGSGLQITSNGNAIQGLRIQNFPRSGVVLEDGASFNLIGGTNATPGAACSGACNLISGNDDNGVEIIGAGTMSNTVSGNYIGTDAGGTSAIRNTFHGVVIDSGAGNNVVGGTSEAAVNLISGNGSMAVFIRNSSDNKVLGNLVGTDASGASPLPNEAGVGLFFAAQRNLVGNNVIASNNFFGIQIALTDATDNVVRGNWIGTNPGGLDLGNTWGGIELTSGAGHNTIGPDNVIRHNDGPGVTINHGGHDNLLTDNEIAYNVAAGVEVEGSDALSNTITVNSIYSSGELGIHLVDGGNAELPAPIVLDYDLAAGTASGTACAGCMVEVFSDDGDEGRWLEGEDVAEAGTWSLSKGSAFTGSHVNATATDAAGNTSQFSTEVEDTCPVVSMPSDSGTSTLRECLVLADVGTTITFSPTVFPPSDPVTITLLSELPEIVTDNLTIDGSDAGVVVDGSQIGATPEVVLLDDISLTLDGDEQIVNGDFSDGLAYWEASDDGPGATRTLNNSDYPPSSSPPSLEWGVVAHAGESGTMYSQWISANAGSSIELRFWYRYSEVGVYLDAIFPDDEDTIREEKFSGQSDWTEAVIHETVPEEAIGIGLIFFQEHDDARISGLSLSADDGAIQGLRVVNFPAAGILLHSGAERNLIGGDRELGAGQLGQGNLLSGNHFDGIRISDFGTMNNTVSGNFIGTDVSGTSALANLESGVLVLEGASSNHIGGPMVGERNLISGNEENGVRLRDDGTVGNSVGGNWIGTDINRTAAIPNLEHGVSIDEGAGFTVIGGTNATPEIGCTGACNLISGNGENGVSISSGNATNSTVSGNYVGTDFSGTSGIGNGSSGVLVEDAGGILIGGNTPGERNVIGGNGDDGIAIRWGSGDNTISGNYVGMGANGTTPVGNGYYGVNIYAGHNLVGGDNASPGAACSGACNLIAGNRYGLQIAGSSAMSNTVTGNYIGTDVDGTTAISSLATEYSNNLQIGGAHNRIGGSTPGERNVMVGPTGIAPPYAVPEHNSIVGNYVGLDATGTACIANGYSGIGVWGSDHVIGGDVAAEGNRICGYDHHGISIGGRDNTVQHNQIWGNVEDGIRIQGYRNLVEHNEIHANDGDGVQARGGTALWNTITENSIHGNGDEGIDLVYGGNDDLKAPVVLAYDVDTGTASGTACAGCVVELFSDSAGEGRVFEGMTTAVATTWSFAKIGSFTGPYIRATATDAQGNTSEFSRAWHDVAVVGATPLGTVQVGQELGVTAELLNQGSDTENDVPVRCAIADPASTAVYSTTRESDAVPAGTYALLAFSPWTPNAEGAHILTCRSMLPGDEVADNDVYTRVLTATLVGAPDVWTKDNVDDTGDVPSGHPWWVSPDIWVRHQPDGGLVHENPTVGVTNTVYVRLRNRGEQAASGEVGVFWDRSRIGWPCKVDGPNIGSIPFEDLAPGEVRIVNLPWVPQEPGHHGLHTIIEAEGDPADWSAPCSPHRPRWDNNVSWHNVIAYYHPTTILQQTLAVEEAVVDLVNVYEFPKDVEVIVERGTFPAAGTITLQFTQDLFDRWLAYEGRWTDGAAVITASKEFTVTGEISATIGGLSMGAGEEATATLVFEAPDEGEFEVTLHERVDGLVVGGVTYQWLFDDDVPPGVITTSPPHGAEEVAWDMPIVITFTESIGPLSFGLTLTPTLEVWTEVWNEAGTAITVTHSRFAPATVYTATARASDAFANPMAPPHTWSFTTREGGFIYLPLVMRSR